MKTIGYFGILMASIILIACGGKEEEASATDETTIDSGIDTSQFMTELSELESRIENSAGIPKEQDVNEAITKFQDFASLFPDDPEAPDYLLRASDLALLVDKPEKSVKLLKQIIDRFPTYNRMEDVKYNRASHLDFELRDTTRAKEAYQEFLEEYPESPLVNDCKSRIENIQYSLEELTEKFMKELEESGS